MEAKRLADAVAIFRDSRGVHERKRGRTYGCLRCGIMFTVTPGEVFSVKGPTARKPEPEEKERGRPVTRASDPDIAMTADMMR